MNLGMIKKMQKQMEDTQKMLEESVFTGEASGGSVAVTMNGKKEVSAVKIDPALVDPEDVGFLEDLVMIAINDANKQVDAKTEAEMSKLTGGMKIPGLF